MFKKKTIFWRNLTFSSGQKWTEGLVLYTHIYAYT